MRGRLCQGSSGKGVCVVAQLVERGNENLTSSHSPGRGFKSRHARAGLSPLLLAICALAQAQTPTQLPLTWSAPAIEFTNGTPIPGGRLYGYEIDWFGATSNPWYSYDSLFVDPAATSASIPVICGSYSITISSVFFDGSGDLLISQPAGPITYNTGVACPPSFWPTLTVK